MRPLRKVLRRTLVAEFYRTNAGFFLITIGLGFGFLKTPQHLDIATALAYDPLYYIIPFTLWLLYSLKVVGFIRAAAHLEKHSFLNFLVILPKTQRIRLTLYTQVLLLAPILGYGSFLSVIAFQQQQWDSLAMSLFGHILILSLNVRSLHLFLVNPRDRGVRKQILSWTALLPKSLSWLFVHQLFNRKALMFLGVKLISLVTVIGFIRIYEMEGVDERLAILGLLLSSGINAALVFHYYQFTEQTLVHYKNLPINKMHWAWTFFHTYVILFVPELGVYLGNMAGQVAWHHLLQVLLFPMALCSFYHGLLYWRPTNMEHFVKYPFFGTAILFFMVLGYVPTGLITGIALALGLVLVAWKFR